MVSDFGGSISDLVAGKFNFDSKSNCIYLSSCNEKNNSPAVAFMFKDRVFSS
jgi:hypothetical protein